jgi:hypothetical protein
MNIYYVYTLRVEGDADPFYVGKGKGRRAYAHFAPSKVKAKSHKNHTIRKAWESGKEVLVDFLVKDVSEGDAIRIEAEHIAKYGRAFDGSGILTNLAISDEGGKGFRHSEEAKAKISEAGLGRRHSEEARKKIADAARRQVRKPVSEETKAKLRAARANQVRKPMTDEQKAKLRAANLGHIVSDEVRKKIAEGLSGRPVSEATRNKISMANTGKKRGTMSEENRKKISDALSGRKHSEERIIKSSESRRGKKRTPEQIDENWRKYDNCNFVPIRYFWGNVGGCEFTIHGQREP